MIRMAGNRAVGPRSRGPTGLLSRRSENPTLALGKADAAGSQGGRNYNSGGGDDLGYDNQGSASNQSAIQKFRSSVLICPSSPINPILKNAYAAAGHLDPSYAGVAGAPDAAFRTVSTSNPDRCPRAAGDRPGICSNGIFVGAPFRSTKASDYTDVGRRPQQVSDGLSKVIAIGEQSSWGWATSGGNPVRCRCRASGFFGWANGAAGNAGNRIANSSVICRAIGTLECAEYYLETSNQESTTAFRSSHGPGAQFAWGDGRVSWLEEGINFNLYQRLAIVDTSTVKDIQP